MQQPTSPAPASEGVDSGGGRSLRDAAPDAVRAPMAPVPGAGSQAARGTAVQIDDLPCVRCLRHGPGHVGTHIARWEEVGR